MAIVIALTAIQFRFIERRVHYVMTPRWRPRAAPGCRMRCCSSASPRACSRSMCALVGSTLSAADILDAPMPLLPGPPWPRQLSRGARRRHGRAPAAQPVSRDAARTAWSWRSSSRSARSRSRCLSAYAVVFFRFPLRMAVLLGDLRHPDAAGRGAHHPDLQDRRRPRPDRHLCRADHPADRLGHRDAAVPPVLPDHPRRAGRGGARSTAPGRCASSGTR